MIATHRLAPTLSKQTQTAVAGLVLLIPAITLVSFGLSGLEPPAPLVHPALVLGGILIAITLNALSVLRFRVSQDGDNLMSTVSVRVRGSVTNLIALTVGSLLVVTIATYMFVESFQPRQ